jgi:hypothetical protein
MPPYACRGRPVTLGPCTASLGTFPSATRSPRTRRPAAHRVRPSVRPLPRPVHAHLPRSPPYHGRDSVGCFIAKLAGSRLFKVIEPPSRAPAVSAARCSTARHWRSPDELPLPAGTANPLGLQILSLTFPELLGPRVVLVGPWPQRAEAPAVGAALCRHPSPPEPPRSLLQPQRGRRWAPNHLPTVARPNTSRPCRNFGWPLHPCSQGPNC